MDKSKIGIEIAATMYKYMDMNTKTVKEADFSKIALEIVKLFAIPDAIKSVCDCSDRDDCAGYGALGERACIACKDNKQTVL